MPINIANFFEASRYSARAGETFSHGMVAKVLDWGNGERKLMKIGNGDAGALSGDKYAVVTKFSTDALQVQTSTVPSRLGSRLVTITSGDHVVGCEKGSIIEYSADLLHASLDPTSSATRPSVGDTCGVKDSMFCAYGESGSVAGKACGDVFRVFGNKVLIRVI